MGKRFRNATYAFRIQDHEILILTDCTGQNPFALPIGSKLVYSEDRS